MDDKGNTFYCCPNCFQKHHLVATPQKTEKETHNMENDYLRLFQLNATLVQQEIDSGNPYFVKGHYDRLMSVLGSHEKVIRVIALARMIVIDKAVKGLGRFPSSSAIMGASNPKEYEYRNLLEKLPDPSALQHNF
jgi:hypothetical protein